MPHVYYLNPPPNPFWDFVTGLEDHPFFRGPPGRPQGRFSQPAPPQPAQSTQPAMSEKARGKQASVEDGDPPEVDPSTINPKTRQEARDERRAARHEDRDRDRDRFRGRGRFANAFDSDEKDVDADKHQEQKQEDEGRTCRRRDGRPCRMGRRDGPEPGPERAWSGPPPFMHPFFARGPGGPRGPHHPGPPGPPFMGGRGGHGHHHAPHPLPPPQQRAPFDLNAFLNNLGERIGIDLTGAAASLGLDTRFTAPKMTTESDFEPRTDIFENADRYAIHLSLPGAKKEDVAVDYDGEHSTLRITGVVHRPEVDEKMLAELVVDGRKRETGVFEKAIRLGTKKEPASVDVHAITARMADGVLIVRVPKVEVTHVKKEVPISSTNSTVGSRTESAASHSDIQEKMEKRTEIDADVKMHDEPKNSLFDPDEQTLYEVPATSLHLDEQTKPTVSSVSEKKEEERQEERDPRTADSTMSVDDHAPTPTATATSASDHGHEEDDWDKFSDDHDHDEAEGEGEYVKIAVN